MNSKHWYKVTAPDGYQALELAYSPHDACRRAAENRPGYAPHKNAGQKTTSQKVSGTLAGTEKMKQRKDCYDKNKD